MADQSRLSVNKSTWTMAYGIIVAMLLLFSGCDSGAPTTTKSEADQPTKPAESTTPESAENDSVNTEPDVTSKEMKVYGKVPQFELTNQDGKPFNSGDLDGDIWVANFFFCRCRSTCPEQSRQVAKLQNVDNVRFVSVTVEPEYDTPEALKKYGMNYEADFERWQFLTGSRKKIWDLSKKGFFLPVGDAPAEEAMPIFHSSKLILVDGEQQIRGFYESQKAGEMIQLKKDIEKLLAMQTAPAEDPASELARLQGKVKGAYASLLTKNPRNIFVPSEEDLFPEWMEERAAAQIKMVADSKVFHDFRFTDVQPESGITFLNQVVEDAGKYYTTAHYDHGNGVAIADVDNDGYFDIYFTTQIGSNELYRNLGNGKFENITEKAGVGLADRISVTASFADVD
ncbi:MAG: SCO family protein, partial [Planctomycetota bacterium]